MREATNGVTRGNRGGKSQKKRLDRPNLLETGIFTAAEAAELVETTERRIRGWIAGYPDGAAPIIENELGWLDGRLAFSFANLLELRFVAVFANAGVSISHIRSIMHQVRDQLHHPHPFATDIVFKTDGRKIVASVAELNGVNIVDLRSGNYEMPTVVLRSLRDDVQYDPRGDAMFWRPRASIAPNVIIHPRFVFGRPVIRGYGVPTRTIVDAVSAEGSERTVAALYEIPPRFVREAVKFEQALKRAA